MSIKSLENPNLACQFSLASWNGSTQARADNERFQAHLGKRSWGWECSLDKLQPSPIPQMAVCQPHGMKSRGDSVPLSEPATWHWFT